jgi:hypothetical protein
MESPMGASKRDSTVLVAFFSDLRRPGYALLMRTEQGPAECGLKAFGMAWYKRKCERDNICQEKNGPLETSPARIFRPRTRCRSGPRRRMDVFAD